MVALDNPAGTGLHAEATWTQNLADWIGAHLRAFEFIGGTPEILVPDNLKSGVTRACRYEPDLALHNGGDLLDPGTGHAKVLSGSGIERSWKNDADISGKSAARCEISRT